jgi:hypothetical protein
VTARSPGSASTVPSDRWTARATSFALLPAEAAIYGKRIGLRRADGPPARGRVAVRARCRGRGGRSTRDPPHARSRPSPLGAGRTPSAEEQPDGVAGAFKRETAEGPALDSRRRPVAAYWRRRSRSRTRAPETADRTRRRTSRAPARQPAARRTRGSARRCSGRSAVARHAHSGRLGRGRPGPPPYGAGAAAGAAVSRSPLGSARRVRTERAVTHPRPAPIEGRWSRPLEAIRVGSWRDSAADDLAVRGKRAVAGEMSWSLTP